MQKIHIDLLTDLEIAHENVISLKNDYKNLKHEYETELLNLKYSEEFKQYKTIKEKEERAKLMLANMKRQVIYAEVKLDEARYNKELLEAELRLLEIGDVL